VVTTAPGLAQVLELGHELSNWGRWGPDDERGALNHIGPEQRRRAAAAVRAGTTISLALPLADGVGPQTGFIKRNNAVHVVTYTGDDPAGLTMGGGAGFTDDTVTLSCQGSTQWDALSHLHYDGQLYNGAPARTVSAAGSARSGIDKVHADLVGRGVLLDVARHLGVDCCDPRQPILATDLDACAERQRVTIEVGDIVLVRTGSMTLVRDDDWTPFHRTLPGLHHSVARWLAEHSIAAIAADNVQVEARSDIPGVVAPLHMLAIRDLGVHLGELWYLEELADACAADGAYDFLLAAQALPIVGGCGSPVNPVALR
jgi:kynurenine formamidase